MKQHFNHHNCINFFQFLYFYSFQTRHAPTSCLIWYLLSVCWLSPKRNILVQTISLFMLVTAKPIVLLLEIKRLMLLQVNLCFHRFIYCILYWLEKSNTTLWFYFKRLNVYLVLCKKEKGICGCVCRQKERML